MTPAAPLVCEACGHVVQLSDDVMHDVQARVRAVDGVRDVQVAIVWEPPWTADLMSDVARLQLGL